VRWRALVVLLVVCAGAPALWYWAQSWWIWEVREVVVLDREIRRDFWREDDAGTPQGPYALWVDGQHRVWAVDGRCERLWQLHPGEPRVVLQTAPGLLDMISSDRRGLLVADREGWIWRIAEEARRIGRVFEPRSGWLYRWEALQAAGERLLTVWWEIGPAGARWIVGWWNPTSGLQPLLEATMDEGGRVRCTPDLPVSWAARTACAADRLLWLAGTAGPGLTRVVQAREDGMPLASFLLASPVRSVHLLGRDRRGHIWVAWRHEGGWTLRAINDGQAECLEVTVGKKEFLPRPVIGGDGCLYWLQSRAGTVCLVRYGPRGR